jgi:hypothetical protein
MSGVAKHMSHANSCENSGPVNLPLLQVVKTSKRFARAKLVSRSGAYAENSLIVKLQHNFMQTIVLQLNPDSYMPSWNAFHNRHEFRCDTPDEYYYM